MPVRATPVVPVTHQTEHRVKARALKHEFPFSGADDFSILVEQSQKQRRYGLMAAAAHLPNDSAKAEVVTTKLLSRVEMLASPEA